MPAREPRLSPRERRRRELLRALLEEEEAEPEEEELTAADLAALLSQVRGKRRAKQQPLAGLLSQEQLQGFLWGAGVAALIMLLLPQAKQTLRPLAVATVKSGLDLVDQLKGLVGEAGEGLSDLVAEAQFERMKEAAGPGPE